MKKFLPIWLIVLIFMTLPLGAKVIDLSKPGTRVIPYAVEVYRGTITGLRVSTVNGGATASGGAFIDGLPASIIALIKANPGTLNLTAYDAANRQLSGVLKAAGSAEGLDSELISDPGFDADGDWTKGAGWTVAGSKGVGNVAANQAISQTDAAMGTPGKLWKSIYTVATYTGTPNQKILINIGSRLGTSRNGTGTFTEYLTSITGDNTTIALLGTFGYGFVGTVDDFSVKQVLTPSTSGATIVSAKGGVTYNWAVNQWVAGSYNATSYRVIVERLR